MTRVIPGDSLRHAPGLVVALETAGRDIGTKAVRIQEIKSLGLPVPFSLAIPFRGYEVFLESNGVAPGDEPPANAGLPAQLVDAVEDAYARSLIGRPVVVRSSARFEDSPYMSCSGQYETFLDLRSLDAVLKAIRACYFSLTEPGALLYMAQHGISAADERMGVLIQQMVPVTRAGVLFTQHPSSSTSQDMLAEYVDGLGTDVVAGRSRPKAVAIAREPTQAADAFEEALTGAGLRLERHFGRPQDIEWGIEGEALIIFQSRDITAIDRRAAPKRSGPLVGLLARGVRVNSGVAVGRSGRTGRGEASNIVGVGAQRAHDVIEDLQRAYGVVLQEGGVLSHIATCARELRKPTVIADLEAAELGFEDEVLVIDAYDGVVARLLNQPVVLRKELIFEAAEDAAASGIDGYTCVDKYEGVTFDPELMDELRSRLSVVSDRFEGIQRIFPFDDPDRTYCGISARIQETDVECRVQFKRVASATDPRFRRDREVHVSVGDVDEGRSLLQGLGYVEFERQERRINVYDVEDCRFQYNEWPGASGIYLGVEGPSPDAIERVLRSVGTVNDALSCIDGVEIFERLGVRLDRCTFAHFAPSSVRTG